MSLSRSLVTRTARCGQTRMSATLDRHRADVGVPMGGGHASVHEDFAGGNGPAIRAHQESSDIAHGPAMTCAITLGPLAVPSPRSGSSPWLARRDLTLRPELTGPRGEEHGGGVAQVMKRTRDCPARSSVSWQQQVIIAAKYGLPSTVAKIVATIGPA
jgi:hypothetical protein